MSVSPGEGYTNHGSCTLTERLGEILRTGFKLGQPGLPPSPDSPSPAGSRARLVVMVKARG